MDIVAEIYKWMQIFGTERNIHIGRLSLNSRFAGENVSKEMKLRLSAIVEDLYNTDKFENYILYKIGNCISSATEADIVKSGASQRFYYSDIVLQTLDTIVMIDGSILSPSGLFLHKAGNDHEIDNVAAFDVSKRENIQPFVELLTMIISNNMEYYKFNVISNIYRGLAEVNGMFIDLLMAISKANGIIALKEADKDNISDYISILCKNLEFDIETISKVLNVVDTSDAELRILKNNVSDVFNFILEELPKIKVAMLDYEVNMLYKFYIKDITRYIAEDAIIEGMSELIMSVVNGVDYDE